MTGKKWVGGTVAGLAVGMALAGCNAPQTDNEAATNTETATVPTTVNENAPAENAATAITAETAPPSGATVEVKLNEYKIIMPMTLKAGMTTFNVSNTGKIDHNFEVEGQGIEKEFEMNLKPGQSQTLTVDLKPGTYEVYCPVGKHEDKGMKMELKVTE
jgi:uncharacterized cupredoxin-like copper-binding protein